MTGRNDRCPCGSGKKYKNCCLPKDRAARAQNSAAKKKPEFTETVEMLDYFKPESGLAFDAFDDSEPATEVNPLLTRINAFWDEFMDASYEQQWAAAAQMLDVEPEICDGEMVFEITNTLFAQAIDAGEIERYKQLLDQLERVVPEAYAEELHYILDYRIRIAVIEGDEATIESCFYQFSPLAGDKLDQYYQVVNALAYHGKLAILYEGMRQARPFVAKANSLVQWAYSEYAEKLGDLEILYRLNKNPDLRIDDPTVQQHFAEYGLTPDPEMFSASLDYRAGRKLPSWALNDFTFTNKEKDDPAINDAALLLAAFTYYAHTESGFARTKVEMARDNLADYVMQRYKGHLDDSDPGYGRKRKQSKGNTSPQNPFCPDAKTLDRYMAQIVGFMSFRFYEAFALYELIPAWLRFLTQYNLLTEEARQQTLDDLRYLKAYLILIADKQITDPTVRENLAGWPYEQ